MLTTFSHGAWVDSRTNPLLDLQISDSQLIDWYTNMLVSGTVNYLWGQASIYIYCIPMSEDDCEFFIFIEPLFSSLTAPFAVNSHTVDLPAGLSYYTSQGEGCYYQGLVAHHFSSPTLRLTILKNKPGDRK